MKKQRIFSLLCSLLLLPTFLLGQTFVVQTSRGEYPLVIPEGTTIEQAYIQMAELYLEERFDHEDLITHTQTLLRQIQDYKNSIIQYSQSQEILIGKQKELTSLLEARSKTTLVAPVLGLQASYNFEAMQVSILAGVRLFEKIDLMTQLGYPLSFGLYLGVRL